MRRKVLKIVMLVAACLGMVLGVSADVCTVSIEEAGGQYVYIVGNDTLYPIEYYDTKIGLYKGAMVSLLEDVSARTGIEFAYVHGGSQKWKSGEGIRADIVSSYVIGPENEKIKDMVSVFSYTQEGVDITIGLGFTHEADDAVVSAIKNEIAKMGREEIYGYLMAASKTKPQRDYALVNWLVVFGGVLAVLFVLVFRKFSKLKALVLKKQITDEETGIGNIRYFEERFGAVSDADRGQYTILYIVIDSNFLQVYSGEAVFTDAVKYTANVLSAHEGEGDFSARITENGFAHAFRAKDAEEARANIDVIIEDLNQYLRGEDASGDRFFKVAAYSLVAEDKNCEFLLYNLRRNCMETQGQLVVCDAADMHSAVEEKQMVEDIAVGFANGEFKMYLQFAVDAKTKKAAAAEALSRWLRPDGIVPPLRYIGVMEKYGLISELDYHMFEMVCRQLHKWRDTDLGEVTISCNFTRITISERGFVSRLKEIAEKYVFDRAKLYIEITEDAYERNRERALGNIREAKEMGFRVALDDLGSGYTSLVNLGDYPIDVVKIDREILLKAEKNGEELLCGIVAFAHSLGLRAVCEGVETETQSALAEKTGCEYIQGWYYFRPAPAEEAERTARLYNEKLTTQRK